ncbi:MAG: hypothetical protein ABIF19_04720 [Planctomycetota bacterium]
MKLRLLFSCGCFAFLVLLLLHNDVLADDDAYKDNACVSCHQNLPGKLSAVVQEWTQSIHFRNNVTCDGCHGGDPSVKRDQSDSEEVFKDRSHLHRDREFLLISRTDSLFTSAVRGRSVSYFCGKCHSDIKEKHLGSPHGELGNPTCLYCHGMGSHAIQESSPDMVDVRSRSEGGRCAICHRAATMETVSNIYNILVNAQSQLENSSKLYDWLEKHGYKNLAMDKMHHNSRETLSQLRQTFHSFNMREINEFASSIGANADLTQETYNLIESLEIAKARQAKLGISSVAFLVSFAGLLLIYRKKYLH